MRANRTARCWRWPIKLWRSSDAGCTWSNVAAASGDTTGWYSDLFIDPTSATPRIRRFLPGRYRRTHALWESNDARSELPPNFVGHRPTGWSASESFELESATRSMQPLRAVLGKRGNPLLARSGARPAATWTSQRAARYKFLVDQVIPRGLAERRQRTCSGCARPTSNTNVDSILYSDNGGATVTDLYDSTSGLLTGSARTSPTGPSMRRMAARECSSTRTGASGFVRGREPASVVPRPARARRLFGCGNSLSDPLQPRLQRRRRHRSWTPLLSFPQISGPAACVQSACASDWAYQQSQFAALEPKSRERLRGACRSTRSRSSHWEFSPPALLEEGASAV